MPSIGFDSRQHTILGLCTSQSLSTGLGWRPIELSLCIGRSLHFRSLRCLDWDCSLDICIDHNVSMHPTTHMPDARSVGLLQRVANDSTANKWMTVDHRSSHEPCTSEQQCTSPCICSATAAPQLDFSCSACSSTPHAKMQHSHRQQASKQAVLVELINQASKQAANSPACRAV